MCSHGGRRPRAGTAHRTSNHVTTPPPTAPNGASTFDESGLLALGDQVARSSGGRKMRKAQKKAAKKDGRKRHRVAWVLGTVVLLFVVAVAGSAGYAWYLNHEIHRIKVVGLTDSPMSGAERGTENILLVGSTDRCALKTQNGAYGICADGVNGVNSDVVMILHLNGVTQRVSILSIPRDLFVPNARAEGANKIDAALYQGPSQLVSAIKDDLGISVQHYVVLHFDTFANVVDALGGIKMYFPEPVFDQESGLKQLTTGCIQLNGTEALAVVRARHLQYKTPTTPSWEYPSDWPQETESDLARIRRDHEFLRVLATAVAHQGLDNPITDQQLVSKVAPQLEVDTQLSATDMINLVLGFHSISPNSAPQYTLPVQVDQFGSYLYKGYYYGDIEFPSEVQDHQVIDQFLDIGPNTDTLTGETLPDPTAITLSVLNGTGVYNQATTTSDSFKQLGFQITGIGDTPSVSTNSETTVVYNPAVSGAEADAEQVARSMTGAVVMAAGTPVDGADVTVITGTQFTVNPPVNNPTVAAGGGTTSTTPGVTTPGTVATSTTTTTVDPNAPFAPPSAAVEPLAPWDPRSCTPSGGEGS